MSFNLKKKIKPLKLNGPIFWIIVRMLINDKRNDKKDVMTHDKWFYAEYFIIFFY